MFSTQQSQSGGRSGGEHGFVVCERCGSPITVERAHSVSVEFSVPCRKCGHRGIYFKRMINMDENGERRRAPRD
jgi:hypothetical protein